MRNGGADQQYNAANASTTDNIVDGTTNGPMNDTMNDTMDDTMDDTMNNSITHMVNLTMNATADIEDQENMTRFTELTDQMAPRQVHSIL